NGMSFWIHVGMTAVGGEHGLNVRHAFTRQLDGPPPPPRAEGTTPIKYVGPPVAVFVFADEAAASWGVSRGLTKLPQQLAEHLIRGNKARPARPHELERLEGEAE